MASEELEAQSWYHGMLPRVDVEKALERDGDWLVRCSDSHGPLTFVLSIMSTQHGICHFTLKYNKHNKWILRAVLKEKGAKNTPHRRTVVALIEYYEGRPLPFGYRMVRRIDRPSHLFRHREVTTQQLLGSGNFCDVYRGVLQRRYVRNHREEVVAIKVSKQKIGTNVEAEKAARVELIAEARMLIEFAHPNVVIFYGLAVDKPPIMVLLEFCPGGSLDKHLQKLFGNISVNELVSYCAEVALGMEYLQQKKVLHRDLAARNCLISSDGTIKITDFGLSRFAECFIEDTKGKQLPIRWMAPETLRRQAEFSTKSDVWSFGILVYEIFNDGGKPWPDAPNQLVVMAIRENPPGMPKPPTKTPLELIDIMEDCWQHKARDRPDFTAISTKLNRLQGGKFPPPIAHRRTTSSLPGVQRVRPLHH